MVGDARVADPERYITNAFDRAQQTQRGERSLTSAGRLPYRAGYNNLNRDSSAHVRRRIGTTQPMVRWIDVAESDRNQESRGKPLLLETMTIDCASWRAFFCRIARPQTLIGS